MSVRHKHVLQYYAALKQQGRNCLSLHINGNNVLSRVGVTYKTCFRLDGWIYCTVYIHNTRDQRQCSPIALLHTFQFTVALVVSWQRIYHSLTVTSTHTWSLLGTVEFVPCHFFSVIFDCHLHNSTQFSPDCFSVLLLCLYYSCPAEHFLIPLCTEPTENTVFRAPLPCNGCLIVAYTCVYRPVT
jgi:hypothetical protein